MFDKNIPRINIRMRITNEVTDRCQHIRNTSRFSACAIVNKNILWRKRSNKIQVESNQRNFFLTFSLALSHIETVRMCVCAIVQSCCWLYLHFYATMFAMCKSERMENGCSKETHRFLSFRFVFRVFRPFLFSGGVCMCISKHNVEKCEVKAKVDR